MELRMPAKRPCEHVARAYMTGKAHSTDLQQLMHDNAVSIEWKRAGRHRRAGHLDADRQHRAQQLQDLAPAQALSGGSVCARCGAAAQHMQLSWRLGLHHFGWVG